MGGFSLGLSRLLPQRGGGSVTSSTSQPTIGSTVVYGQVPAGATATCKRNGTVQGAATVTAQGAASYTLASPLVAGDQVSFPWTLVGESPAATVASGPAPSPTLNALTLSPSTATVGTAYTGTISGAISGSTVAISGAGSAGFSIGGTGTTRTLSGTPTAAGTPNFIETLSGATNSPRTTTGLLTVGAASAGLQALSVSPATAQAGVAYSGTITGLTSGSSVTSLSKTANALTITRTNATTATITGTPDYSGPVDLIESHPTVSGSPKMTAAAVTIAVAASKPLAPSAAVIPTSAGMGGSNQVAFTITDNASSLPAQKWGVYRGTTSGGPYTFVAWAYYKPDYRLQQDSGTTRYYTFTAYNSAGESPQSAEVAVTTATGNFNPLRLATSTVFAGQLFYEPLAADFATGSTITATSDDGSTLTTKTQSGAVILYGTIPNAGLRTITFTEAPTSGGPVTSTFKLNVIAKPTLDAVGIRVTAAVVKQRIANKPTYTDNSAIVATDVGTSVPAGYTASKTFYYGRTGQIGAYSTVSSFNPPQYNVTAYDPVEDKPGVVIAARGVDQNSTIRMRLFKQTFVVGFQQTSSPVIAQFKARYSDDNMQTWQEMPDPVYAKYSTGNHYYKIDSGSVPPAGGRIWEIETASYTGLTNSGSVNGFGYETGETPQQVTDTSPIMSGMVDSFMNGSIATDQTKIGLRRAARNIGLLNISQMGIPANRYTLPPTASGVIGLNRVGLNVTGIGDLSQQPGNDVILLNSTINDNAQPDLTQYQAMWTNVLLKARALRPKAMIVVSLGFWAPQDRLGTSTYNALMAAIAAAKDDGIYLNDGIAAGWAIPAGTTGGAAPYWFSSNAQNITATSSGRTLTVTAGAGIEIGMFLYQSDGTTSTNTTLVKQLSGTAGGTGTYLLNAPLDADLTTATAMQFRAEGYAASYPVHPNNVGQPWMGDRMSDGVVALVNRLTSVGTQLGTESGLGLTTESGAPITVE